MLLKRTRGRRCCRYNQVKVDRSSLRTFIEKNDVDMCVETQYVFKLEKKKNERGEKQGADTRKTQLRIPHCSAVGEGTDLIA